MRVKFHGFLAVALGAALVATPAAQTVRPAAPAPVPAPPNPNFRVRVDLVTNDIVVRDEKGNFVPDLRPEDIQVFEDGVLQELSQVTAVIGGRVYNPMTAPEPAAPEGIILPKKRMVSDVSGRIFLFFVDDQHIQFGNTHRVREIFRKIAKELVHDGDLFGIVSSGPSSIEVPMTYDKRQIDEAIEKIAGNELKPEEIINMSGGTGGPTEIRFRAHTAFTTMLDGLKNLEQVHNRRKALVWVSDGYDFAPFKDARYGTMAADSPFAQNQASAMRRSNSAAPTAAESNSVEQGIQNGQINSADTLGNSDLQALKQNEEFADADLSRELYEIGQQANRANTTIYTIDPRGLAGPLSDIADNVEPSQWAEYVRKTQDTMRVLAEDTGGIAGVNTNDFSKLLKKIDADTSDYYVVGYYSNNPDILKRRRSVDIRLKRPGLKVEFRKEYVLRPISPAARLGPPAVSNVPEIPTTKR